MMRMLVALTLTLFADALLFQLPACLPAPEQNLGRHRHVAHRHIEWGDSHETLPAFLREHPDHRCDLLSIDGEHTPSGVLKDLQALLPVANPGATVLIDDCSTSRKNDAAMLASYSGFADGPTPMLKERTRYATVHTGSSGFCVGNKL